MPTYIVVANPDASAPKPASSGLAVMKNPDLVAVVGIAAIGLLVAIAFMRFVPLSNDLFVLLASTS
jgi:hypothetical protein